MARLAGWFAVAAFAAWSAAAAIVSGAEAGGPFLVAALFTALAYKAAPSITAEVRRVRHFEQASAPTGRPLGAHLHGSVFFREK